MWWSVHPLIRSYHDKYSNRHTHTMLTLSHAFTSTIPASYSHHHSQSHERTLSHIYTATYTHTHASHSHICTHNRTKHTNSHNCTPAHCPRVRTHRSIHRRSHSYPSLQPHTHTTATHQHTHSHSSTTPHTHPRTPHMGALPAVPVVRSERPMLTAKPAHTLISTRPVPSILPHTHTHTASPIAMPHAQIVKKAFAVVGFSAEEVDGIYRVVAAIMHLQSVYFITKRDRCELSVADQVAPPRGPHCAAPSQTPLISPPRLSQPRSSGFWKKR